MSKTILDNFEYGKKQWIIIHDDSILPSEHCNYCEFKKYCDNYMDTQQWFACGCTFKPDRYYIKLKNNFFEKKLSKNLVV